MRLEDIRQRFENQFVLLAVTKTDSDTLDILEADVLAYSHKREEVMALLERSTACDVAVEWCGESDETRVVIL